LIGACADAAREREQGKKERAQLFHHDADDSGPWRSAGSVTLPAGGT
jgi:hypothetical protein